MMRCAKRGNATDPITIAWSVATKCRCSEPAGSTGGGAGALRKRERRPISGGGVLGRACSSRFPGGKF